METHEVFEVINTFEKDESYPHLMKGIGKIIASNIPDEIRIASSSRVSGEFSGTVELGFMSLKIQDSKGNYKWFPDIRSLKYEYNEKTEEMEDTGDLTFRNDKYYNEWNFNLNQELKEFKAGAGTAVLGMFETRDYIDGFGNTYQNRPHVDLVVKQIKLI